MVAVTLFCISSEMYQNAAVIINSLEKEIIRLEKDPAILQQFRCGGPYGYAYAIYNKAKLQHTRDQLKKELKKPNADDFQQ